MCVSKRFLVLFVWCISSIGLSTSAAVQRPGPEELSIRCEIPVSAVNVWNSGPWRNRAAQIRERGAKWISPSELVQTPFGPKCDGFNGSFVLFTDVKLLHDTNIFAEILADAIGQMVVRDAAGKIIESIEPRWTHYGAKTFSLPSGEYQIEILLRDGERAFASAVVAALSDIESGGVIVSTSQNGWMAKKQD